ncbi:MAG: hypothetical protein ACP5JJ_17620, partial [Anaerolineae bacterium]
MQDRLGASILQQLGPNGNSVGSAYGQQICVLNPSPHCQTDRLRRRSRRIIAQAHRRRNRSVARAFEAEQQPVINPKDILP